MPPPLLLVDDDLATIAQVKRLLAREGYEVVLATNAADAVIAWGSHLPPLVILNPKVESDRGRVVLEELRSHPDAQLLHVLLLGESVTGFGYPMAALPIDAETFAQTVQELVRGTTSAEGWQVHVSPRTRTAELPALAMPTHLVESESWRATRKSPVPGRSDDGPPSVTAQTPEPEEPPTELFNTRAVSPDPEALQAGEAAAYTTREEELPPNEAEQAGEVAAYTTHDDASASGEVPPPQVSPPTQELENSLFGDLEANMASEVEAQAMARVAASLAQMPVDDELQALEDDVRAEAARRRQARQSPSAPSVGLPTPDRPRESAPGAEESFSGFDEPAGSPPPAEEPPPASTESDDAVAGRLLEESQKARATLARAERIAQTAAQVLAERAQHESENVQALQAELEAARHGLEQAELQTRELHEQLEQTRSALAEAQLRSREEQSAHEQLQAELAQARQKSEGEGQQLWTEVERLENELAETRSQLEASAQPLEEARQQLHLRSEGAAMLELELEDTRTRLDASQSHARALDEALAQTRGASEDAAAQLELRATEIAAARAEATDFQGRLDRIHEARLALERERDALKEELASHLAQSQELNTAASRAAGALREAMEEAEQSEVRAETAQAETQQAQAEAKASSEAVQAAEVEAQALKERAMRAEADAGDATRRATEADQRAEVAAAASAAAEQGLRALQAEVEALKADFAGAHQKQRDLEEALEDARAANAEVRTRADESESKVRVLEERSQMPLKVPNRAPLTVARFGNLELGELARLVGQLVLARAEVRLELAAPGGRRTLWLARGAVIAAESTFGNESLLDRARRDGLIDARQTADLQMIRNASPAETVVVLKERGLVREAEVVPMVQRYVEQVALDAFSEANSEYRLTEEAPEPQTLAATLPRPTLPLVAEALRRALPVEELLLRLGGSAAVPVTLESELDLRALGFADKERRMLGYCDGEANVEDLALASGLKADVAFRAMLVAKLLGLIELKVPARTQVAASPEVDVERLEAKFEQVQEADYFTMLGLGRAAGGDEVLRAWQRLSEEFDPIKYSGHPDTSVQQRAQLVYSVLEEAARALGDDRRRADYARHLVD